MLMQFLLIAVTLARDTSGIIIGGRQKREANKIELRETTSSPVHTETHSNVVFSYELHRKSFPS